MSVSSKKFSITIPNDLYYVLNDEQKRYGYRSLSAYINTLLEKRSVTEIADGAELVSVMHQLRQTLERKECTEEVDKLCHCLDTLMTIIVERIP